MVEPELAGPGVRSGRSWSGVRVCLGLPARLASRPSRDSGVAQGGSARLTMPPRVTPFAAISDRDRPGKAAATRQGVSAPVRLVPITDQDAGREHAAAALAPDDPLRHTFALCADWVSILDPAGRVLFVNDAGQASLGPGSAVSVGTDWTACWLGQARAEAEKAVKLAAAGRASRFTGMCFAPHGNMACWDVAVSGIAAAGGPPSRIVIIARDVTDQKKAEERLQWAAHHDPLTSLPNRILFQKRLQEEIARALVLREPFGLLLLDLDDFKRVNDGLGHETGDALLCDLASRLLPAVRSDDFVARVGGDEFAVILRKVADDHQLSCAASGILDRLNQPYVGDGLILDCHASIGASIFPRDGTDPVELMKNADTALYGAKDGSRGSLRVFAPDLRAEIQVRDSMLSLARDALANNRLIPFYQPKVDLRTGRLSGFEALLRWNHPDYGPQTPETIDAAFRDDRLAAAISDRIIELVLGDMRRWLDDGVEFGHVAINAAAAEFRRADFADRLLDRLDRAAIPRSRLHLEVTESVFLGRGAECVERALRTLSEAGVEIVLDDFGTGYASLSHLKQFPVSTLKIDKLFVRDLHEDPDDEAIVRAVIGLGQSLGIKVVAEGIETPAQSAYLRKYGCDYGQGYMFGAAEGAAVVPLIAKRLNQHGVQTQGAALSGAGLEPARASSSIVYIVDDDAEVCRSTRFLLQTMGYRCRTFASGAEFLSEVLRLEPGCVLLDVRMEGLNGLQVLSEIRWIAPEWPVAIMSGHADEALSAAARSAGAFAILGKPFDETIVLAALEQAFETPSRGLSLVEQPNPSMSGS